MTNPRPLTVDGSSISDAGPAYGGATEVAEPAPTPRDLRRSRYSALWIVANLAAALGATLALGPVIDEQIAAGDIAIAEGFHGLARTTAMMLVLFGTIITYIALRLGAVLIGRAIPVRGQRKTVTLAPVMVRSVDIGHLVLSGLLAVRLPQLVPPGLGMWVLLAISTATVVALWLFQSSLRNARLRTLTVFYSAAVAVPVLGVALTQIARW